jgi:hypothetical protein
VNDLSQEADDGRHLGIEAAFDLRLAADSIVGHPLAGSPSKSTWLTDTKGRCRTRGLLRKFQRLGGWGGIFFLSCAKLSIHRIRSSETVSSNRRRVDGGQKKMQTADYLALNAGKWTVGLRRGSESQRLFSFIYFGRPQV